MRYGRMPVSEATRLLLCDFAAGDLNRPLHHVDADWDEVFVGVCRNGLLGLTHRYLEARATGNHPPQEFRNRVHQGYRFDAVRMALMYQKIGQFLAPLAESDLALLVTKGPAVAQMVYPDPMLRSFTDLDVVVRERDWTLTHKLLVGMGFRPEKNMPYPPPKLVPEAMTYELRYWHPKTGLLMEVHYDDILNAGLASRDIEGYWQRATAIVVSGMPTMTLSLEDHLIQLCMHLHYHSYTRLLSFSDIAFIVRDHGARVNWEHVLETVQTEDAQVGVYYTLRFLDRLLKVSVPPGVLDALRPDRFRRWWHELYLPEEEVLSLQPMSRPAFSFYFIPLFRRLIPDLLVMGRRGEKLRYLLRLLLPPSNWLRDYYALDSSQNLVKHYLLHPLKLSYHYLSEIANSVFTRVRGLSRELRILSA